MGHATSVQKPVLSPYSFFVVSVAATAAAESNCNSSLASVDAIIFTPRCLSKTESGLQAELYRVWATQVGSRPPPLRRPEDRLSVYGAAHLNWRCAKMHSRGSIPALWRISRCGTLCHHFIPIIRCR